MRKIFEGRWQLVLALLSSLVFGFCWLVGHMLVYSGGIEGYPTENYIRMPALSDMLIFLVVTALCFALVCLLYLLCRRIELRSKEGRGKTAVTWFAFAFVLLAWLPYILSCYPGIFYGDSISTLTSFKQLGYPNSNHHPVLYTYAMGAFYNLGCLMGNESLGMFFFALFQCLVMAFTAAKTVEFMKLQGAGRLLVVLTLLFYALLPNFPILALGFLKDPLYTCVMMWLMFELYSFSRHREWGPGLLKIAAISFLLCFLRNNGIYVIAATAVCLVLMMKKMRVRAALLFLCVIIAYYGITVPGYKKLGIDQEFVESVGIPVQQMAAVIYYDGQMSEEDRAYVFELMPQWAWEENYKPCLVDSIKWNYFFNEEFLEQTKGDFIKTWFSMFLKNPVTYVRAYLLETHGFWKLGSRDIYGLGELDPAKCLVDNTLGIESQDLFEKIFGVSILDKLEAGRTNISAATLFWLMLGALLLCIMQKRSTWIVFMPAFANWLTVMISTPVAYSLRYVYIFAFALPLFLVLPFVGGKDKNNMVLGE